MAARPRSTPASCAVTCLHGYQPGEPTCGCPSAPWGVSGCPGCTNLAVMSVLRCAVDICCLGTFPASEGLPSRSSACMDGGICQSSPVSSKRRLIDNRNAAHGESMGLQPLERAAQYTAIMGNTHRLHNAAASGAMESACHNSNCPADCPLQNVSGPHGLSPPKRCSCCTRSAYNRYWQGLRPHRRTNISGHNT